MVLYPNCLGYSGYLPHILWESIDLLANYWFTLNWYLLMDFSWILTAQILLSLWRLLATKSPIGANTPLYASWCASRLPNGSVQAGFPSITWLPYHVRYHSLPSEISGIVRITGSPYRWHHYWLYSLWLDPLFLTSFFPKERIFQEP